MKAILPETMPRRPHRLLKKIRYIANDLVDRWRTRNGMVPPKSLNFVGGGDFEKTGEEFIRYFLELGHLKPHHTVLDVGCGIGRMAIPLTKQLSSEGAYYGFDIVPQGIDWCNRRIAPRFPNFHFLHSDVFNKVYNSTGPVQAQDYKFPFADNFFDFVFLTSVFTHMLRPDMHHYLREIARVLKPGGKCLATFFLLNEESTRHMKVERAGISTPNFKFELDGAYTTDLQFPEGATAYTEEFITGLCRDTGLRIDQPIHYGAWCGRPQFLSYQDIVVVTKA